MVKVANLSADLTANTSTFDQKLQKSGRLLDRTGKKMEKNANSFNKKVSRSFRNASRNIALLEGPLGGVAGRLSALSSISGTSGLALLGVAGAIAALGATLAKTISIGNRFEGSMNRVVAIIKATGGAAGLTAKEIRNFSQELARGTLASVEGVESAAAKLLTFRSIAGDTFKRTLVLAQDLAATGFGSLSDNVTQLGKALEDPIRNLGALTRNGVSFSQGQKDVIKTLVETGQAAAAQTIILDALAQQVGGAGSAEGGAVSKAFDSLVQSTENWFNLIDQRGGLTNRFASGLDKIRNALDGINTSMGEGAILNELLNQLSLAENQLEHLQRQLSDEKSMDVSNIAIIANIKRQIELTQRQVDELHRLISIKQKVIETDKREIEIARNKSKAEQAAIVAEAEAGRAAEATAKIAKERIKIEKRHQEQIQKTIQGLQQEVEALGVQNMLLEQGNMTIQEAAFAREVLLMQQKLNISEMDAEGQVLDALVRKRGELTKSIDDETKLRERVKQIIKDNKTETEKLNEELAEFTKLRNENRISEEEYQRAVERTKEKIGELDESQQRLKDTIEEVGSVSSSVFKDFVLGVDSASDALRNLGLRLAGLIFDKTAGAFLEGAVESAAGSLFGGFFAGGGRPPVGKASVIGERGPELFVPDTAGTIIPNDALSGGGGNGGITIHADMRGAAVEAVQRLEILMVRLNGSIEPRAIDAVVGEKQRNPALFG